MYSKILESVFGSEYLGEVVSNFADGAFSLVNASMGVIKAVGMTFQSQMELSTDFQVAVVRPSMWESIPVADRSGYNSQVLNENGSFSFRQAYDEYLRRGTAIKIKAAELMRVEGTLGDYDSQEAFLLNMLISWFKATLVPGAVAGVHSIKQHAKVDSHVRINTAIGADGSDIDIQFGHPNKKKGDKARFMQRDETNFWNCQYVVRYTAGSDEQQAFYLAHLVGREGYGLLSADIDLTCLNTTAGLLIEPIGDDLPEADELDYDAVPWGDANMLYTWIRDYVELNRCYKAFAAAMDVLGALAYNPMPSYHESAWWHSVTQVVHVASFSPTRARVPKTLDGDGVMDESISMEFFKTESLEPRNFLLSSAVANYAMWMGLYAAVVNSAVEVEDWRHVLVSNTGDMPLTKGVEARASLISVIVQKEVTVLSTENAYIDFDLSTMAGGALEVEFDEVKQDSYTRFADIEVPVPYVSGALFAGCCNIGIISFDNLAAVQKFTIPTDKKVERDDAFRLASIYRYFGQDVGFTHLKTRRQLNLWANHRELALAHFPLQAEYPEDTVFKITGLTPRQGRNDPVIDPLQLRAGDTVEFTILRPILKITKFGTRREMPSATARSSRKRVLLQTQLRGGTRAKQKVWKKSERTKPLAEQDFRMAEPDIAPTNPLSGEADVRTTSETITAEQEAVETAG